MDVSISPETYEVKYVLLVIFGPFVVLGLPCFHYRLDCHNISFIAIFSWIIAVLVVPPYIYSLSRRQFYASYKVCFLLGFRETEGYLKMIQDEIPTD